MLWNASCFTEIYIKNNTNNSKNGCFGALKLVTLNRFSSKMTNDQPLFALFCLLYCQRSMDKDGTLLLNLKRPLMLYFLLAICLIFFLLEVRKETKPIEALPECVKLGKSLWKVTYSKKFGIICFYYTYMKMDWNAAFAERRCGTWF